MLSSVPHPSPSPVSSLCFDPGASEHAHDMTRTPVPWRPSSSGVWPKGPQPAAPYVYLAHQIPLICAERHFKWDGYPHRLPYPTRSYLCVPLPFCRTGASFDGPSCRRACSNLELRKTDEDECSPSCRLLDLRRIPVQIPHFFFSELPTTCCLIVYFPRI